MFESGHFLICFAYDRCFLVQIRPAHLLGLIPAKTSSLVVKPPHPKVAPDDLFDERESRHNNAGEARAQWRGRWSGALSNGRRFQRLISLAHALAGAVRDEVLEGCHHTTRPVERRRQSRVARSPALRSRGSEAEALRQDPRQGTRTPGGRPRLDAPRDPPSAAPESARVEKPQTRHAVGVRRGQSRK